MRSLCIFFTIVLCTSCSSLNLFSKSGSINNSELWEIETFYKTGATYMSIKNKTPNTIDIHGNDYFLHAIGKNNDVITIVDKGYNSIREFIGPEENYKFFINNYLISNKLPQNMEAYDVFFVCPKYQWNIHLGKFDCTCEENL